MNREEAVLVLKELFDKCTFYDGNWLALMPPNSADLLSHGYQVHIRLPLDSNMKACMHEVLKKYRLDMKCKEDRDVTIIYKPKRS